MKKVGIIAGFAAAAAAVLLGASLVVTYPNEYKLIRQFGEIVRVVETPGVSLKVPFLQTGTSIPKSLQIYDIPQSDVITKDKKTMIADAFVLWKISDPVLFTRHLNGQVAQAQSRIAASVFSIAGHYVGSGMVMKNGNKIVRPIILIVLVLLFIKIITGM